MSTEPAPNTARSPSTATLLDDDVPDRRLLYARAAELVGAFAESSGATDLASRHDDCLDEVFAFDRHFEQEGFASVC